ncbi:AlpA family phage regulatory protein [Rhodanobacter sp. A1T4]|uniref:helix-turn-helix transcriptional regulator n=1 Tax=Rhodanobacter sp. A1T4 TaxID=2723087 RepID=UPI001610689E|nr:AlpA family phage regulatory protein [Rhodanobacter sp. A1T4]MBB6246186.1 putative DNA-binding transcriptional regulator AlpA [Rhodanobacter sp. A1T4]
MQPNAIPITGFLRQAQLLGNPKAEPPIAGILPIGASTLWRWIADKKFPKPLKLSQRVTAWKCEDIRAWMDAQEAAE